MNQKSETLGERINRIRGKTYQADFGKRLGVSQGTVSAWERDDKDRPPSADMCFRLATLSSQPGDQAFFLQKAGLSQGIILSAAEQIRTERTSPPIEGEIFRVPVIERTFEGDRETGRMFPVAADRLSNPSSTIALLVHESCANRTLPPGDLILLDTSHTDTQFVAPFLGQTVLVDIDWNNLRFSNISREHFYHHNTFMGTKYHSTNPCPEGLYMGLLRLKQDKFAHGSEAQFLSWTATVGFVNHFEDEPGKRRDDELHIGEWYRKYDEATAPPERLATFEADARKQILSVIRFEPPCGVLGRVIGWYPSPPKGEE